MRRILIERARRRLALKVIKLGMDTKQVVARFEAEREALAMMDHPNIAKVLDAGATETSHPVSDNPCLLGRGVERGEISPKDRSRFECLNRGESGDGHGGSGTGVSPVRTQTHGRDARAANLVHGPGPPHLLVGRPYFVVELVRGIEIQYQLVGTLTCGTPELTQK